MGEEDVLASVSKIIVEVLDEDNLEVTRELSATNVEAWDSLNHIVIVAEVEDEFGLNFKTTDLLNLVNVGDFVDLVLKELSEKN